MFILILFPTLWNRRNETTWCYCYLDFVSFILEILFILEIWVFLKEYASHFTMWNGKKRILIFTVCIEPYEFILLWIRSLFTDCHPFVWEYRALPSASFTFPLLLPSYFCIPAIKIVSRKTQWHCSLYRQPLFYRWPF